ncbi:MAG: hypothetical protein KGR47_06675 [Acidobacteria bacterium]|nr:hypothetical protein [Acidobacteriota bacterium]
MATVAVNVPGLDTGLVVGGAAVVVEGGFAVVGVVLTVVVVELVFTVVVAPVPGAMVVAPGFVVVDDPAGTVLDAGGGVDELGAFEVDDTSVSSVPPGWGETGAPTSPEATGATVVAGATAPSSPPHAAAPKNSRAPTDVATSRRWREREGIIRTPVRGESGGVRVEG